MDKSTKLLAWAAVLWTVPFQYGYTKGFQEGIDEMLAVNKTVDDRWKQYLRSARGKI